MRKLKNIAVALWLSLMITGCGKSSMDNSDGNGFSPQYGKLEKDVMTPEVLWSFGRIGGMNVSPDGTSVLYGVSYTDIERNKSFRDLYVVPAEGGKPVRLTNTEENEFNAVWRPDGKKIGFLAAKDDVVQLWEINPDGSGLRRVSNVEEGITGFKYAPDISKVFYIQRVKLKQDIHDRYPDLPLANARIEDDIMYRHWDSWHDYRYNHIFIANYNAPDGSLDKVIDIMEGEPYDSPMLPFGGVEEINWSPDGNSLAYTCKKKVGKEYAVSTNSEVYLYNTQTGQTKNLTVGMMGYDRNPLFSPDGKQLAWESMERDGYEADKNRLFTMNLESGDKKYHTVDFDQNVHKLVWSKDGKSIYFISDIHATDEIFRIELENDHITRLTDGVHNYQTIALAGDHIVAQKVSMSQPAELYRVNPQSGTGEPITKVTKPLMDEITMGKVEKRWVKTTDNKDMLVWVIYPPHFDPNKKYPALLYCQGGPQGTVSQFWSYRWNFQMMAANDYIIVAPNRRGLPGFGQEWCEQISKDYGGQNQLDYLSAIDAVAKERFVDENRLGAVGASYGGYSVFWLAGNHEKRFKAFISHCGIFNFDAMYPTTEEMFFVNWEFAGAFWEKENAAAQKSYQKFSPHHYVGKWDTPILVIHGEKDFRIPYTQGMGAFNSAVLRDIPARFLYFPEENHWVLQPQNGILWQREFFRWLDEHLKR